MFKLNQSIRKVCLKAVWPWVALWASVGFLMGCQDTGLRPETAPVPPRQELVLWTLQLQPFAHVVGPLLRRFEEQHPGWKVRWVDLPFSEGEKRTLAAVLSGQPPDVVNLNPSFSALLASRQALVDMQQAVPASVRARYFPPAWQALHVHRSRQEASSPGVSIVVGLPWYLTASVTLVNSALLRQTGWTQPPQTLAQLPEFCREVRRVTSRAYCMMPNILEKDGFLRLLQRHGVSPRATDFALRATPLLAPWVDLYRQRWIPPETLTEGHRAAVERYQSGQLAMLGVGPNFLKVMQENAAQVYQETQVFPQFPQRGGEARRTTTTVSGARLGQDFSAMLLAVPVKARHPKAAVALAVWLTSPEAQRAFCQALPVLPSTTQTLAQVAAGNLALQGAPARVAQARQQSAQYLLANPAPVRPIDVQQTQLQDILHRHIERAVLGRTTPAAAMHEAQQEISVLGH
jgi:putative chitobiose transport system substrate-binding protein